MNFTSQESLRYWNFFPLLLNWNVFGTKLLSSTWLLTQNLKPKKLHQYDTALIQTPSELEAKSFPEDWCPKEPASAIQVMTFVDKVWSINNAPKNRSTAWHWPPCGLLLPAQLALSMSSILPVVPSSSRQNEPSELRSTPHKHDHYRWPTWTQIQVAESSPSAT